MRDLPRKKRGRKEREMKRERETMAILAGKTTTTKEEAKDSSKKKATKMTRDSTLWRQRRKSAEREEEEARTGTETALQGEEAEDKKDTAAEEVKAKAEARLKTTRRKRSHLSLLPSKMMLLGTRELRSTKRLTGELLCFELATCIPIV